ncbi:MAG: DNA topoisomerase IB [Planctomycetaceae bacterium]|nr:DNA topoisomerase IB [Planctomycetaceae bacterium]
MSTDVATRAARSARLRYVQDDQPGIRRERRGQGFRYVSSRGRTIRDPATLARIRALVIPPAWTDVWICPHAQGHLQVTGHDARGRKQYRYHDDWRRVRDETKFDRMLVFGACLPRVRRRVQRDLAGTKISRERVLATIVRLMETTAIRVGNEEYAKTNGSFGLTTLRDRHAQPTGGSLRLRFRGKSGQPVECDIDDARIARIVRQCRDLPGSELFQYRDDDGRRHTIRSQDVNDYLREISGAEVTAKDFRTWTGTVLAAQLLAREEPPRSATAAKATITATVKAVASKLNNTVAVCRKCYIHPQILADYEALLAGRRSRRRLPSARSRTGLRREEVDLLRRLEALASNGSAKRAAG